MLKTRKLLLMVCLHLMTWYENWDERQTEERDVSRMTMTALEA